jgi:hypothetical protein
MPRGPAPLKVTEPPRKDFRDVPEAVWQFPHRVVRRANELGLKGQLGIAEKVGVKQPLVSNTLSYRNIRDVTAATVRLFAIGLECPMGWLFYGEGEVTPTVQLPPPGSGGAVEAALGEALEEQVKGAKAGRRR